MVSAAAGAVGASSGQLGKIMGCRVVGIAGGADKCRYLVDELGFDAAIDYKHDDVRAKPARSTAPQGIDVYFDNVGGDILDIALGQLRNKARVVICGAISQYNNAEPRRGSEQLPVAAGESRAHGGLRRVRLRAALRRGGAKIAGWHRRRASSRRARTSSRGSSTFPEALGKLFRGENFGKLVLKI